MATSPVITGAPTCAPATHVPAGDINAPTRRGFIGALATVPIAGTAIVAAAPARAAIPAEWYGLLSAYQAAKRVEEAYDTEVFYPRHDHLTRIAPYPGNVVHTVYPGGVPISYRFDYNDTGTIDLLPNFVQDKFAEMRAEHDAHRAAWTWPPYVEAEAESERLSDISYDLREKLIVTPAPDRAALLWKLEHLFGADGGRAEGESGDCYCGEWIDALMADAHRLLGNGRA